ncbi:MerR family transcriptional regulator [Sediminimonas sp.]|uniref:MerR family transcriptional regulator n=1 Tax=Sediminimonas sp. TaxID=2823379 RepID=UPI0025FC4106|nr:MerR family transcriptional regulator [Sediminimonas sp.]
MGGKSPDAFRTISEVAEWLDRPAHVLRFWESKFAQIKPVKRAGGRRYYRPQDMLLLGGIKKLLHDEGMTIKGVQKVLREHGVKYVADLSDPLEDALATSALGDDADTIDVPAQAPDSARVLTFPTDSTAAPRAGGARPEPDTDPAATGDTPTQAPEAAQDADTAGHAPDTPDLFNEEDDHATAAPDTPEDDAKPTNQGDADTPKADAAMTDAKQPEAAPSGHAGATGADVTEQPAGADTPAAAPTEAPAPSDADKTPGKVAADAPVAAARDEDAAPKDRRAAGGPAAGSDDAPALLARIAALDTSVPPPNCARVRVLLDQLIAVHSRGDEARDG